MINPKVSGNYILGVSRKGYFKLMIDDKVVFDNSLKDLKNDTITVDFVAGNTYKMVAEYKKRRRFLLFVAMANPRNVE